MTPDNTPRAARPLPITEQISLPLPRPILRVLQRHRTTLEQIAGMQIVELDRVAANASAALGDDLRIVVSAATLRRSLGPQIIETSGDLALAQLVCGDSFGRPSAQQHYYAPRRKDIAAAYRHAVCRHCDESTTSPILSGGEPERLASIDIPENPATDKLPRLNDIFRDCLAEAWA